MIALKHDEKKVLAIVEVASDGGFWCYTETPIGSYVSLSGHGISVTEAENDFLKNVEEAKVECERNGIMLPEVEFEYKYDIQSFFNYFSFLNVSEVAKMSCINASQMRQYTSGMKKAGNKVYLRLSNCVSNITKQL